MGSTTADRVLSFVVEQRSTAIEWLRHLVDAESPSAFPESHRLVISVLTQALTGLGFRVRIVNTESSYRHVFATRKNRTKGTPCQLLIGHYDTVWPLGTTAKRPMTVDGNIIRGPGTFDMKGGLTQIFVALQAIQELDLPLTLEPVIFINSDEEIGSDHQPGMYARWLAVLNARSFSNLRWAMRVRSRQSARESDDLRHRARQGRTCRSRSGGWCKCHPRTFSRNSDPVCHERRRQGNYG